MHSAEDALRDSDPGLSLHSAVRGSRRIKLLSDPHVVRLRYQFISANEFDRFSNAKPLSLTADDFDLRLEDGLLTASPQGHFATVEEACAAIDPYLRSWVACARLERARRDIRFEFDDAEMIDRTDGSTVHPSVASASAAAANAAILVDNVDYPRPPGDFRTDLVLDEVLARLAELDAERTSITDATYWVVTRIEAAFGAGGGSEVRRSAAATIAVDHEILSTMARLARRHCGSDRGRHLGRRSLHDSPSHRLRPAARSLRLQR